MSIQSAAIIDDAYAKRDQVFPRLTAEMVNRSLPYGQIESFPEGATIYARGTRGVDFLIVLSGQVIMSGLGVDGENGVVIVHEAREFTGELDLFSEREALVSARAASDAQVLRIRRSSFRHYVSSETGHRGHHYACCDSAAFRPYSAHSSGGGDRRTGQIR